MIFQLIAPFSDLISWVVEHMGSGEFLPSNWLMDLIADFVCGESVVMMEMMNILVVEIKVNNIQLTGGAFSLRHGVRSDAQLSCTETQF